MHATERSKRVHSNTPQTNPVPVQIKLNSGGTVHVSLDLNTTVQNLKQQICHQNTNILLTHLELRFEGESLENYRSLKSYNIQKNSLIFEKNDDFQVISKVGFLFNGLEKTKFLSFSKDQFGPIYMNVTRGLNLRAKCLNDQCMALNKVVWIRMGMGEFDIGKHAFISKCPACLKIAKADNLGLWDCIYTIDGIQTKPVEKQVFQTNLIADATVFTTFDDDKDIVNWAYLKITTAVKV